MKLLIPKITLDQLSNTQQQIFYNLNTQRYGEPIASAVVEKLMSLPSEYDGLYFSHKDYCGIGMFYLKEKFILSTVYDGYNLDLIIAEFNSKNQFVTWLSNQSDQSMSLYGERFNNQTITKIRLNWFLEDHYSPVWNSYCNYLKDLQLR